MLELFTFRALARANFPTWLASLAFHYGLLLVLIVHIRFMVPQLPLFLLPFIRLSGWATLMMSAGLLVLLLRRLFIDRLRYISSPSDYLHIILLLLIAASGAAMKRIWPVDLFAVGQFLQGAVWLDWKPLPDGMSVQLHVWLVVLLMMVFPVSKLLHGIGIVFSPTLNQRDTSQIKTPSSSSSSLPSSSSPTSRLP